jgi:hypothetical protein
MQTAIEIAESIARDTSCVQGEFKDRVLAIIPYLDEIERLRAAIKDCADGGPCAKSQLSI